MWLERGNGWGKGVTGKVKGWGKGVAGDGTVLFQRNLSSCSVS